MVIGTPKAGPRVLQGWLAAACGQVIATSKAPAHDPESSDEADFPIRLEQERREVTETKFRLCCLCFLLFRSKRSARIEEEEDE